MSYTHIFPRRAIAWWLLVCCTLTFSIVVVGGVTRLTRSGLSITEWKPVTGTLPPMNDADWNDAFTKYQATPEYQLVNKGMSLGEFKGIFWWEYIHRLLGRLIGIAFMLPFLYFLARRQIHRALAIRLAFLLLLIGFQGFLGWYMVKSGLVNEPHVSHLRLTAHLGLAVLLYIAMLRTALQIFFPPMSQSAGFKWKSLRLVIAVYAMMLSGALVAGLKAGKMFNTFPLMGGRVIPVDFWGLDPWYKNFLDNAVSVQFEHRLFAWVLFFWIPLYVIRNRSTFAANVRLQRSAWLLVAALVLQITLGIVTLLLIVPVSIAALHQAGAMILLTAAIWHAHFAPE